MTGDTRTIWTLILTSNGDYIPGQSGYTVSYPYSVYTTLNGNISTIWTLILTSNGAYIPVQIGYTAVPLFSLYQSDREHWHYLDYDINIKRSLYPRSGRVYTRFGSEWRERPYGMRSAWVFMLYRLRMYQVLRTSLTGNIRTIWTLIRISNGACIPGQGLYTVPLFGIHHYDREYKTHLDSDKNIKRSLYSRSEWVYGTLIRSIPLWTGI